jgi:hypothetical protein
LSIKSKSSAMSTVTGMRQGVTKRLWKDVQLSTYSKND